MVFVRGSDELLRLLKEAGIQVASEPFRAEVSVVEIPRFLNEINSFIGNVVAVVTGGVDYATICNLKDKGVTVVSPKNLVPALLPLLEQETTQKECVISFGEQCDGKPGASLSFEEPPDAPEGPTVTERKTPDAFGETKTFFPPPRPAFRVENPAALRHEARFESRKEFPVERPRGRGFIAASFSTKGGAGKTALATNLAALCALRGMRVALVDLDLGTGNTHEVLGLHDALKGPHVGNWRDYARGLSGFLTRHSSGLYLLPCCEDVTMQGQDVEDLAEVLSSAFDLVVMDFGTKPFFPYTRAGLEIADRVFVLALQEQGMVEVLVSRFLAERKEWVESGKAVLVVNKVSPLGYYKPSQVAKMAGFRTWKEIPDDPKSFEAAKKAGKAVVQLKGSEAGNAFAAIADEIELSTAAYETAGEQRGQKKGFLGRLFRGGR